MTKGTATKWYLVLCVLALLEFIMLGSWKNHFDIYFSPIVFALSSLGIAWAGLYASAYLTDVPKAGKPSTHPGIYAIAAIGLVLLCYHGYQIFSIRPIDYRESDVFAQVLAPNQYLLGGKFPYIDVELPGYTMHNTYLPMQWLPFMLPVALGFDPRWVPLLAWSLAIAATLYILAIDPGKSRTGPWIVFPLVLTLCIYVIWSFMDNFTDEYYRTIELLPAAYYVLLIIFLLRGNWAGIGVALGSCLLSRFSVIFLLPFLAWYIYKRWGSKVLQKSGAVSAGMILFVFVLPFLIKKPEIVSNIIQNYNTGALTEWSNQGWQKPGDEPYQIARGLGVAIFVKKLYEYDTKDGIHHLKQAGIFFSVLVGIFMIYLYQRNKSFLNHDWLLLGGIKLYFTVFYTLSLIPYAYLFLVPASVTIVMILRGYTAVIGCFRLNQAVTQTQNL